MLIATVGDNCMDVYAQLGQSFPGGNAVNVAIYLKRLGEDASYTGVVGDDQYGEQMKKALAAKGVDISHLHTCHGSTAITMVNLVNGERIFGDYIEGVMEDFKLTPADVDFLCTHDLVHSGIWGKIENDLPAIKQRGATISFDFSDQLEHEIVPIALPHVDYAFFSYKQDDDYIRQYIHKAWNSGGPRLVVATLGENGSLAFDGANFTPFGIVPVEVVDSMGAGDSFIAGFMQATLKNAPLIDCLRAGAECSAITLQYTGAWNV